jgi:amidohydrolase
MEEASREAWGTDRVLIIPEPSLGAEDFSVYLDRAPGCMFRLGVGSSEQLNHPLHHPQFAVDESAILTGVITMAYAAYKYWQK